MLYFTRMPFRYCSITSDILRSTNKTTNTNQVCYDMVEIADGKSNIDKTFLNKIEEQPSAYHI